MAAGSQFPGLGLWAWAPAVLLLAVILYKVIRRQGAAITPLVLCGLCGYLSIQPWLNPNFADNHIIHYVNTHPWRISGTVAATPWQQQRRTKFTLNVTRLETAGAALPTQGKIRVTVFGQSPVFEKDDQVSFTGRLRAFRNFNNPGNFDYQRYMALRNIWGTAYTDGAKLKVVRVAKTSLTRTIDRVRNGIAVRIEGIVSDQVTPASKALLKALIIGDRSGITPEWRMAFNRSGVGHLLAISGLHIGIIAATAFWLLKGLMSYWRVALWRAWVGKGAAGLTLIPVIAYGLLAGMSPSTQRALIMVSVFLAALLVEREQDLFNTCLLYTSDAADDAMNV